MYTIWLGGPYSEKLFFRPEVTVFQGPTLGRQIACLFSFLQYISFTDHKWVSLRNFVIGLRAVY